MVGKEDLKLIFPKECECDACDKGKDGGGTGQDSPMQARIFWDGLWNLLLPSLSPDHVCGALWLLNPSILQPPQHFQSTIPLADTVFHAPRYSRCCWPLSEFS